MKVKVINIDENNRINLSIKQAQPRPARPAFHNNGGNGGNGRGGARPQGGDRGAFRSRDDRGPGRRVLPPQRDRAGAGRPSRPAAPKEPRTFDDMLKQFMSDSDSKLSGRYDKPSSRRRNNGRKS